ncbi:hypothetical protein AeMF1_020347, partial [Aphanomyces euteiches]
LAHQLLSASRCPEFRREYSVPEVLTSGPSINSCVIANPRDRHKFGGEAGLFDSDESAQEASPSPAALTSDMTESDMALIPFESPLTTRKRDLHVMTRSESNPEHYLHFLLPNLICPRSSSSGPASKSLEHLPSLPLSSFDMDLSLQMVLTDNMEVETPESSVETTLNFSAQMQTLWSQMENYASTISDFENRLTLVSQSSLHQHDLTAASLNSINSSFCDLADKTSQVHQGLISTRSELHSMISELKPPKSPIDETDIARWETTLTNQQIAISNLQQSLQLQAKEQQRFSEKLQTLAENRAADFHRILHEVQVLTRAHEENRVVTQQQLNQSELTLVDLSSSNKNLGDLVIGLTKENSLLSERLRSFEGLLEQRETKSTPESVQSPSSVEPPPATPVSDITHQLLLDLQSALVRMESEMSDIKESLDTSINSQAFGRAVKYTTVPTSDEQAHCEFFIKQLVDQAKLCHLSDEECKLLGLKLTSDKVHPALNQWWIAYSKTKSDVWTEIYDNFKDRFCNRTQRELVDKPFRRV